MAAGWEIVVCDNGSTDGTGPAAAAAGARVVFEPFRQIARARNAGAADARGEWLLFVDADSFPSAELVADVLDLVDGGRHVGCGATLRVVDGSLWNKLRLERLNPFLRAFGLAAGAFVVSEADAFRAIGGFDESLFAFEEFDFVARLKREGRRRGQRFTVLYEHPVATSGRRGVSSITGFVRQSVSMTLGLAVFVLNVTLPRRFRLKRVRGGLSYWYRDEREE